MNWYKIAQSAITISIDLWQKSIQEYLSQLVDFSMSKPDDGFRYTQEEADQNLQEFSQQTYSNMQKIANTIQEAILKLPDWSGSSIVVEARTYDKDNDIGAETDAEIHVGKASAWGGTASFTLFTGDSGIMIDDLLEAGDTDFFSGDATQSDYFSLVQELRNPGSSSQKSKILTLYTARPVQDRQLFEGASAVPSNIFLTTDPSRATGIASDMGQRDVWQVKIDERSLVNTLDAPNVKDYQAVNRGSQVPIDSIILWSEGELV